MLLDGCIQTPFFRLVLSPWSRRAHSSAGGLGVHVNVEIEGIPAHAWSLAAVESILTPTGWVERLAPVTRTRADMALFRLTAWCSDPSAIPCALDFHVVEPDEAPPPQDMAAPADLVAPPNVKTRVSLLLIHVTRTVDYRRPTAADGAADSTATGGAGPTPSWPTTRHYDYVSGQPDSVSPAVLVISPASRPTGPTLPPCRLERRKRKEEGVGAESRGPATVTRA